MFVSSIFHQEKCLNQSLLFGPRREKPVFGGFANSKGADQPAHTLRLISAFVIHILESLISKLATNEISFFLLVSVAGETGLILALSETPKTGFVAPRPNFKLHSL